ncbi:MAG: DoxX family membrane protein [Solirubrobacterales bacterium]|nr:DoxX family membrane protein [Solirubrobacterales bacterium]
MGSETAADPRLLARGLAALRIFVGVIAFSNGLAKLLSFREIDIGPYFGTLVDRPEARGILDFEINQRGGGTDLPLLPTVVNDIILPSYDVQQWLLTFTELGTGALLIVGLFSRGAALVVFAQHFFLQLVYFSSGRFAFEQPHEWLPPFILALVPAGLVWGLDGRLARNRPTIRWPS